MFVRNPISLLSSGRAFFRRLQIPIAAAVIASSMHSLDAAFAPPSPMVTVKLAWNPVTNTVIQGYRLYVGTASNQYSRLYETGANSTFSVGELVSGQTYYFAVRAVGNSGVEGDRSVELVVPVSSRPLAAFDSYTASADTSLIVPATGVLANDSDMDSTLLTAVLVSAPAHGSLALNSDGGFVYTPPSGFTGTDSFVYHASDGYYSSDPAIVEIVVKEPIYQMLVNGSFEDGHAGWTATGNQTIKPAVTPYRPSDGNKLVAFNSENLQPGGRLMQTFATVAGATYSLSFDTGIVAYNFDAQRLLVTVTGGKTLLSQTINATGNGTGSLQWNAKSYTFVADSALTTLAFKDDSATTVSIDLLLDNVSVTGPRKSEVIVQVAESATTPLLSGRPGAMNIAMTVPDPGIYSLQRSEDLVVWETIGTSQLSEPGRISFTDSKPPAAATGRVFYRIGFP